MVMISKILQRAYLFGLIVLLSACGGGSGPLPVAKTPTGITYPACLESTIAGKANIAGCWISERCASNTSDGVSVRYMAEITEEEITPVIKGRVYDYLLTYDNTQCNGDPVGVLSMDAELLATENAVRRVDYSLIGFEVCDDTQGGFNIPCIAMDMRSEFQHSSSSPVITESRDVYYHFGVNSGTEWHLCWSSAYSFDNKGDGGIGVGDMLQDRDVVLDMTDCLTRFEP